MNEILNLDNNEVFGKMKQDFNNIIQTTLYNMEDKKSTEGEIKISLKIDLVTSEVVDQSIGRSGATREVVKPVLKHKVSSAIQIKDDRQGKFCGDIELVWDSEEGKYFTREIKNNQMSFDDAEEPEEPKELLCLEGEVGESLYPEENENSEQENSPNKPTKAIEVNFVEVDADCTYDAPEQRGKEE